MGRNIHQTGLFIHQTGLFIRHGFFCFWPLFSLFSFCKQRRRRRKGHPPKEAFNPPKFEAAYFFIHQLYFAFVAFGGLWWMENIFYSKACDVIHQYPPIHQCFAPTQPEEVFL